MLRDLVAFLQRSAVELPQDAASEELPKALPDQTLTVRGIKIHLWFGAPGGGFAPPPAWVPPQVRKQYEQAWNTADQANLLELGYGEDDDGLERSEGEFDDASGFTAIAREYVDLDRPGGPNIGIIHYESKPVSFRIKGQPMFIWGGVSGV